MTITEAVSMGRYLFAGLFLMMGTIFAIPNGVNAWEISTGNPEATRYFDSGQISASTIEGLKPLWRFDSGFSLATDTVQSSPIFTGELLVTVNLAGDVIALNPENGQVVWRQTLKTPVGRRGLTFHPATGPGAGHLYVPTGDGVVQLDAASGQKLITFESGISLLQPHVTDETIFVATLHDGLKAYDTTDGSLLWHRTLNTDTSNIRIWSGFSYDPENNLLFVVTSNPGGLLGQTNASEDYSVSIVAIRAITGEIHWHYQHIDRDVWDLDIVGNPIVVHDAQFGRMEAPEDVVLGLSKTGEIIVLRVFDGAPAIAGSIKLLPTDNASDALASPTAKTQNKVLWPDPVSSITLDLDKAFRHLNGAEAALMKGKLRHAKSGWYLPPSANYDVVLYGLHGGPEWPGAALAQQGQNVDLIVPFNRNPWILRVKFSDTHYENWIDRLEPFDALSSGWSSASNWMRECWQKLFFCNAKGSAKTTSKELSRWSQTETANQTISQTIYEWLPGAITHKTYQEKCSQCHGVARQGSYQSEFFGDDYQPSLIGLHLTDKWRQTDSAEKLTELHKIFDIGLDIDAKSYDQMMRHFRELDDEAMKAGRLKKHGFWQLLLDGNDMPATKPPWGGLASVSLKTGRHNWSVALGTRSLIHSGHTSVGDINFGGVMATAGGLVFATGTPDQMIRAIDVTKGKVLWQAKLPFAGSAPPMGFQYRGCDMVAVMATGGRFLGFQGNGDSLVAFKLDSCVFD